MDADGSHDRDRESSVDRKIPQKQLLRTLNPLCLQERRFALELSKNTTRYNLAHCKYTIHCEQSTSLLDIVRVEQQIHQRVLYWILELVTYLTMLLTVLLIKAVTYIYHQDLEAEAVLFYDDRIQK